MDINSGSGSARGGHGGAYQDPSEWEIKETQDESKQTDLNLISTKTNVLEEILAGVIITGFVGLTGYAIFDIGREIFNYFK